MDNKLETRIKKFNNSPDRERLEYLVSIEEEKRSEENIEFLFKVIETEKFEKIRIKAIFVLKEFEDKYIINKLCDFFSFERDTRVRLALLEVLSSMSSDVIENVLINAAKKDENDVIRSMGIKHLHERANMNKKEIKLLLMDIIQNDKATFPKQMALSILSSYAMKDDLDNLKFIFERETKFKMKQLIHKTMGEIASDLKIDLDIAEPIEEKDGDEETDKKKRRKRKKKKKKDEEFLYF
jgi:hypothetical protein